MKKLSLQKQLAVKPLKAMIDMAKEQERLLTDKELQREIARA